MTIFFKWLLSIGALLVLLAASLALTDSAALPSWLGLGDLRAPLYAYILTATAFGFIWGCLWLWLHYAAVRAQRADLKRQVKQLEKTVDELRAQKSLVPQTAPLT